MQTAANWRGFDGCCGRSLGRPEDDTGKATFEAAQGFWRGVVLVEGVQVVGLPKLRLAVARVGLRTRPRVLPAHIGTGPPRRDGRRPPRY